MNTPAPQIRNPLDGVNFGSDYLNWLRTGAPQPDRSEDLLQIDLLAGTRKTITDNAPTYAVVLFGLILIGAGVYSLAK